jgi:anaerobic magnesium-protoporphyrin IX monomethyl ester cyclase
MRLLLINQGNGVDFNQNPPLGILYLAASLREAGHEVDVYDQGAMENNLKYPSFDLIRSFKPGLVGFSLYTFGLPKTLHYINELKESFPGIKIIAGGHHATALPQRTMDDSENIDYLLYGEGEVSLINLLSALESGLPVSSVKGIYYREAGKIFSTDPQPLIEELDRLPFPANDLIEGYTYPSESIQIGKRVLNLTASRGCPFSCAYCNKAVYGSSYRRRSAKNVADEIECMFDRFGYDEVMFHDELFTINRPWMHELFDEFKTRGLKFPWRCLGRVGTVNYDDLVAMKENGCYIVAFGLEAGNEKVRSDIGRKMTDEKIRKTFQEAKRAGLVTYAFNMINHRLDTFETMRDTYNLMCEVNAEFSPVFICSPLPGTSLHALLLEDRKYDWERFNSYRDFGAWPISISSVPERELTRIASQMEGFYYSRLRYLTENILLSRFSMRIKAVLLKLWLGFLLTGRLKHLARDDFFITGRGPSKVSKFFYRGILSALKRLFGLMSKKPLFEQALRKITQGEEN